MKNGQDAAELPRRKRGRPPGSRKTTKPELKSSEPRNEQPATIGTSSEKRWNSDEGTSSLLQVNEGKLTYGSTEGESNCI